MTSNSSNSFGCFSSRIGAWWKASGLFLAAIAAPSAHAQTQIDLAAESMGFEMLQPFDWFEDTSHNEFDAVILTGNSQGQRGYFVTIDPLSMSADRSFSAFFTCAIGENIGEGADGISFYISQSQNPVFDSNQLFAVHLDTYHNSSEGETTHNSISVDTHTTLGGSGTDRYVDLPFQLDSDVGMNQWHVWIDYNGATSQLEVRISAEIARPQTPTLSATVPEIAQMPESLYVGVAAETGLYASRHELKAFLFSSTYLPLDPANEIYGSPYTSFRPQIIAYNGPSTAEQGGQLAFSIDDFEIVDPDNEPAELWLEIFYGEGYDYDGNVVYFDGGAYGPTLVGIGIYDGFSTSDPFYVEVDVTGYNLPPTFNPRTVKLEPGHPYTLSLDDVGVSDPDNQPEDYYVEANWGSDYDYDWQTGQIIAREDSPASFTIFADVWYLDNSFYRTVEIPAVLDQHAPTIGKDIFYLEYLQVLHLSPQALQVSDADTDLSAYWVEAISNESFVFDSEGGIHPNIDQGVIFIDILLHNTETGAAHDFQIRVGVGEPNSAPVIQPPFEPLNVPEDGSRYVSHEDVSVLDEHYPTLHTIILHPGENYTILNGEIHPDPDYNGVLTVPVTVSDGEFESEPYLYTVNVSPVDDPPVLSLPTLWLQHGVAKELTLGDLGFSDVDNDPSDYFLEVVPDEYITLRDLVTIEPLPTSPSIFSIQVLVATHDQSFYQVVQVPVKIGYPPTIGASSITIPPDSSVYLDSYLLQIQDPDTPTYYYDVEVLPGEGYTVGDYYSITPLPDAQFFTIHFRLVDYQTQDAFGFSIAAEVRTPQPVLEVANTSISFPARGPLTPLFQSPVFSGDPVDFISVEFANQTYRPGEDFIVFMHQPDMPVEGWFDEQSGVLELYLYEGVDPAEVLSQVLYLNTASEPDPTERLVTVTPYAMDEFAGAPSSVAITFEPGAFHALSFGANDVAAAPGLMFDPYYGATFEAWIRPSDSQLATGEILSAPTYSGLSLTLRLDEGGALALALDGVDFAMSPQGLLPPNVWTHLAVVLDPQTESALFLRNGEIFHSASFDYSILMGQGGQIILQSQEGQYPAIPATRFSALDGLGFEGEIDEFRLWSTARSDSAISANLRQPISPNDPDLQSMEAYFHFDEGAGLFCTSIIDGYRVTVGLGTASSDMPNPDLAPSWRQVAPVIAGPVVRTTSMDEDNSPRRYRPISFTEGLSPIPEGPRQWYVSSNAAYGFAFVEASQTNDALLYYEPFENENGLEVVTIAMAAQGSAPATAIAEITINPRNDAPVNVTAPQIMVAAENEVMMLAADSGIWEDSVDRSPGEITFQYRWEVADNDMGANATVIDSQASSINVQLRDLYRYFQLTVIATDNGEGTPLNRTVEVSTGFRQMQAPPFGAVYEDWILHMLPSATEAERHPDFDFDGDSLPNSYEQYMGLDPSAPDTGIFHVQPEVVNGQPVFALYFTVLKSEPFLPVVSHSHDMSAWTVLNSVEVVESSQGTYRYRATVPFDNQPHFFKLSFEPMVF